MPELPEVETVRRFLEHFKGKIIKDVIINYPKMIENVDVFKKSLIDKEIVDIKREGKWLIFVFNDFYLLSHLRMEGKYISKDIAEPFTKHEHVIFNFDEESLRYNDTRKFGRMYLVKELKDTKTLMELGLEPLNKDFNLAYLKEKFKKIKKPIKEVLLDQRIISGIGNIYADEILFASKINPLKKAFALSDKEILSIIKNAKEILEKAINEGGTTIKSYASNGHIGNFQNHLKVHTKKECLTCKSPILKIKVGGRGTYYCPICQKES
jgi:formamidopyrimidine-DNA glycosylase